MLASLLALSLSAPAFAHGGDPGPAAGPEAAFWSEFVSQGTAFEQTLERRSHEPIRLGERDSHLPLLKTYRWGHLAVLEDDYGLWFEEAIDRIGSQPERGFDWILTSLQEAFYDYHEDEYDYIVVLLVRDVGIFGAFYSPLANDTQGLGYAHLGPDDTFDYSIDTQLQGFIFMNSVALWTENPEAGRWVWGQEFMHRWGAFVHVDHPDVPAGALLGRDLAHWSYWLDTDNSPMEGNRWIDHGDGTWSPDAQGDFAYHPLDLYLMGLAGPDEVPDLTWLDVSQEEASGAQREDASTPEHFRRILDGSEQDVEVAADAVTISLDDIVAAEGPRTPDHTAAPAEFRVAFVVLALDDDPLDDATLQAADDVRTRFEAEWEEDVLGRADMITTLGPTTAPWLGNEIDYSPEEPRACGCATPGGMPAVSWGGLLFLLALRRRR